MTLSATITKQQKANPILASIAGELGYECTGLGVNWAYWSRWDGSWAEVNIVGTALQVSNNVPYDQAIGCRRRGKPKPFLSVLWSRIVMLGRFVLRIPSRPKPTQQWHFEFRSLTIDLADPNSFDILRWRLTDKFSSIWVPSAIEPPPTPWPFEFYFGDDDSC